MTPEQFNQLRGACFVVKVMDTLRAEHAAERVITLWSLHKTVGEAFQVKPDYRVALHARLRSLIKQFERGGLLTTRLEWNAERNVNTKIITLL